MTEKDKEIVPAKKSPDWTEKWWDDRKEVEDERVKQYREKWAQQNLPIKYEQTMCDIEKKQVHVTRNIINQTTIKDENVLINSTMCAAFGSASNDYNRLLESQTVNGQFLGHNMMDAPAVGNATIEALVAMGPRDIFEGQLCSRLLMLNSQINEYLRRAALPDQLNENIDLNTNRATKLSRVYNETLEVLNKHRRKGKQEVVVQHVQINGGQAIVSGQFNQGEGGSEKK